MRIALEIRRGESQQANANRAHRGAPFVSLLLHLHGVFRLPLSVRNSTVPRVGVKPRYALGTSGRQARRGGNSRCLARKNFLKPKKIQTLTFTRKTYAYGIIRRTFAASAGLTTTDLRSFRMRPGAFEPSKCRLPECALITLPVEVTRNRLAAPRCVFNFLTFGFAFDTVAPFRKISFQACPAAAGFAGPPPLLPFFGASSASRMFASMRGPNSTNACSPISWSSRVILARPTSWWAISRPR